MKMKKGFTMLEVLLALVIAGFVMTSMCALLFNMVKIMEHFEEEEGLEAHADCVESFLATSIASSKFSKDAPETLLGSRFTGAVNVSLGRPPEGSALTDLQICYGVEGPHPFYTARLGLSPEKVCWLDFSDEGLNVLWCFVVPEDSVFSQERTVYKSPVSKYVKKVQYLYIYSDDRRVWEDHITDGQDSSKQLPAFLKIDFERGGEKLTRLIPLFTNADPYVYSPEGIGAQSGRSASGQGGGTEASNAGRRAQ